MLYRDRTEKFNNPVTQFQFEFNEAVDSGRDLEEFMDEWHKRACRAYRQISTPEEINDFRCGRIKI